jgi:hypothetical protein
MIDYQEDGLSPEYNIGFGVSFGGAAPPSASVQGNVSSPGACTTCGANRFMNVSFPLVLIAIAVIVLAFRR